MSNYIKTDIVDEVLRQIHNPNNRLFAVEVGIMLGLLTGIIFLA